LQHPWVSFPPGLFPSPPFEFRHKTILPATTTPGNVPRTFSKFVERLSYFSYPTAFNCPPCSLASEWSSSSPVPPLFSSSLRNSPLDPLLAHRVFFPSLSAGFPLRVEINYDGGFSSGSWTLLAFFWENPPFPFSNGSESNNLGSQYFRFSCFRKQPFRL